MVLAHAYYDFADRFSCLAADHAKWSQATFGADQERGPIGALKHLEKEAKEAYEAVGTQGLPEELADCFLLILDASRRAGIKPLELVKLAQQKMQKNKARTWAKPVADEPVEHVKPVDAESTGKE